MDARHVGAAAAAVAGAALCVRSCASTGEHVSVDSSVHVKPRPNPGSEPTPQVLAGESAHLMMSSIEPSVDIILEVREQCPLR